ncbi:hypothetical protein ACYZTX_29485 [Pseudomonas sp. MDT1-17]
MSLGFGAKNGEGTSLSRAAWHNGISANQLFQCFQKGSVLVVSAREAVVPASELTDAPKQIRELQRILGKTMPVEVRHEAEEIARPRIWIAYSPYLLGRLVNPVNGSLGVARSQLTFRFNLVLHH